MHVLVTGATGYIGGRLVPELLDRGHTVRCGARTTAKLQGRPWSDDVEVARLDVHDPASLRDAFQGVEVVYHLVHSMGGDGDFRERDRAAAANVRDAAAAARVRRLVYLGGLGDDADALSAHLRSRHEVGRVLAAGPVPVTELRAAMIVGSGSASFEMLRHLTEVLPAMVTPRWVDTRCQPIAVRDVLGYLCDVLEADATTGQVLQIGGPDVLTYREMMQTYAAAVGLRRRVIVPIPVLTPSLSSLWVGLVTPLPPGLARPLIDGLSNEVIVRDDRAALLLPREPLPFQQAVARAVATVQDLPLTVVRESDVESPETPRPEDPTWAGGCVFTEERFVASNASADALDATIHRHGAAAGRAGARSLWRLRGALDRLAGGSRRADGSGARQPAGALAREGDRGRRGRLEVGDVVEHWRVEAADGSLRLRTRMRLPGDAWLEYRVRSTGEGSWLQQRVRFHPRGLLGRCLWAASLPLHGVAFGSMASELARRAEDAEHGS